MKKKFLALVALLCSATICATVGATVMNNNVQTVSAEATTSTWTDTATGTTYTFEGDVNETKATLTTTDLGDLGPAEHRLPLATATGLTAEASNMDDPLQLAYNKNGSLYLPDQAWTGETGGIHFAFKTEDAWYKPAGTKAGTAESSAFGRMNFFYGNLYIDMQPEGVNGTNLQARLSLVANGKVSYGSIMGMKTIAWGYFNAKDGQGKNGMSDYSEIKIAKYKCTSADGYWLKVYITKPGEGGANFGKNACEIYNGYVNAPMSDTTFDYFAIRNASMGYASIDGYKITETGYGETYQNRISIRRGDMQVKATEATETYKDVADMTDINKTLAEDFTMGLQSANVTGYKPNAVGNDIYGGKKRALTEAIGMEFRTKHVDGGTAVTTKTISECFMILNIGVDCVYVNYNNTYKAISFMPITKTSAGAAPYNRSLFLRSPSLAATTYTSQFTYDPSAEYAWRITSSPVKYTNGDTTMNNRGTMVRIYFGKVDATTGMPATNWADTPILEYFSLYPYSANYTGCFGLGVDSTMLNATDTHEMVFSSNQYVGIKTVVDEDVTVNKIARGGSYTLADLTGDDVTLIGWSKGAKQYVDGDLVNAGTELTGLKASATYTAIGFKLTADEKASIRFRRRTLNDVQQPLEISLKWNVTAEDIGNAGYYFGDITFGYKLTASNGKTVTKEVRNVSDGVYDEYTYSVIQSNITSQYYDMKFVCQGYVTINGQTYYTELPDMDANGRSVDFVADAATADLKGVDTNGTYVDPTYGVAYSNAIKDSQGNVIGYHYLTQAQYDLVKSVGAVNA